jgi:hypothetical protein
MFEKETTQILLKFLERKCREAEKEIEEKGVLSDDKAVPLLLKSQFNHIAHLDSEITALRELMDKRFERIEKIIMWLVGLGITAWISIIIAIVIKK